MRLALNEARDAFNQGEVPIGAVIVSGGSIVGRGHNLVETLTDVTAHAEIQALTAASATLGGKYLPDCTLYVTVEPCVMCAGALAWSQIGRIVYGASDPKRGYTRIGNAMLHPDTRTATDCKCHTTTNTATNSSPCVATDTTSPARGASDGEYCMSPGTSPCAITNFTATRIAQCATSPARGTSDDGVATQNGMVATPPARVASYAADTAPHRADTTPPARGTSEDGVATHNGMVATPPSRVASYATDTTSPTRGASDEAADKLLLHPKTRVTAGVLAAECEALMSEFFMKLRR